MLNVKDSRWLQLEVCREFQRNKCTRPDTECKFAHPPAHVEVQNGRVTACYDSIKGRCNREKPPCKYFHPPQHLKDQLLINGRNHLALKNALMQQMGMTPGQPMLPGQLQALETEPCYFQASPYLGVHQLSGAYPFVSASPVLQMMTQDAASLGVVPTTVMAAAPAQNGTKVTRADRIEPVSAVSSGQIQSGSAAQGHIQASGITIPPPTMSSMAQTYATSVASLDASRKRQRDEELQLMGFPGMVQYKRTAGDKSGVPVYQPATAYQQAALMQLQQPFVPVSCEYNTASQVETATTETKTDMSATSSQLADNNTDNRDDPRTSITTAASNLGYIVTPSGAVKREAEAFNSFTSSPYVATSAAQNLLQASSLAAALNPLSYTGLSLNKQLTQAAFQQQLPQYAGLQFQYPGLMQNPQFQGLSLPGMGGVQNYFQVPAMNQQLQFLQPGAGAFGNINPYASILGGLSGMNVMPGLIPSAPSATPGVLPAASVSPTVAAAQAAAMAQAGLNPYKKMRTM
ncbi:muscleblind-like protein isoform X2 [Artemia franciscana]|uniref:muscleblind-like protein isoform X2 n=1 Tax=Artemia franciscana TaxID=6661 RepID=UPI0032DB4F9C